MTHTLNRRKTRTMPGGIGGRAQRLLGSTCGRVRQAYRDDCGSAYVFTALTFTAMIGFVGIGIDVTNFYAQRRITQNMADAAAVAGTYADMDGGNVEDSAEAAAEDNGYDKDGIGNSLTVADAASGLGGGLTTARVDVTVQRRVPLIVTDLFTPNAFVNVSARAVGGTRSLGPLCIVALDQSASRALEFTGNTTANVGCGVASNSSAGDALYVGGSATLVANPAQAHGGIIESGSGDIQTQLPLLPYAPRVADPYTGRTFPGPAGCAAQSSVSVGPGNSLTLDAGGGCMVIDGGADIKGTLSLGSGTYYIDGGDLSINAQAIVEGLSASSEVTLVLTGSTPADVGDIDIRGGATVTLKAPDSGDYQGIVIYQDKKASANGPTAKLNGGAGMNLTGAIYIPSRKLEFAGGFANNGGHGCTRIIAKTVKFTGNSTVNNHAQDCQDAGVTDTIDSTQQQVVLVQ